MNKRIVLSLIFIVGVFINLYNFTDVFGDTAIPKFRPFGSSTTFADSTNYVNLNKGFNIPNDSMKVGKYLFVGTKGGGIYLDTNKMGEILYSGTSLRIINNKENGSTEFYAGEKSSEFYWYKSQGGSGYQLMQLDSVNGLSLFNGLSFQTTTTGQIKLPSDTATDYDANDAVTINRQSGKFKTKALTTASGVFYDVTLTNSLISASTKVFAIVEYGYGTNTSSVIVNHYIGGSGSAVITLLPNSAGALNGTVGVTFVIFN